MTDRRELEHLAKILRKTGRLVSFRLDVEERISAVVIGDRVYDPISFAEFARGVVAEAEKNATPYQRHMIRNPDATISEPEWNWLQHINRWGSTAYPVRKMGRKWFFERLHGAGGCPSPFTTKAKAFTAVELYYDVLLDKNAGREPGTTTRRREEEAAARARGEAVT